MNRKVQSVINNITFSLMIMAGIVGCRNVPIQANGDQDSKPVIDQWFCETYPFWFGGWFGKSPQQVFNSTSQKVVGGSVRTQGVYSVEFASNILCDLSAVLTLGGVSPVHVKCVLQDDDIKNWLPKTIIHERPKE